MKYFTETDHLFLLAGNRCNDITEKFGACFATVRAITGWDTTKTLCIEFPSLRQ